MTTKKKILIADDDADIINATLALLDLAGYEVIFTVYGDAVPQLVKVQPQLILLDLWTEGFDSRNICKKLKSDQATASIPVILFSDDHSIRQSVFEAGADDFIGKPFEMNALVKKIEKLTYNTPPEETKGRRDLFSDEREALEQSGFLKLLAF